MKTAVIVFPGSNCDRDLAVALEQVTGRAPAMVWHGESELPSGVDFIGIPGGFSYGDYLRSGAMAARSPIVRAVIDAAGRGVPVLGVCNGFQVLTETGLLPGALMRNAGINFVSRPVALTVENSQTLFTSGYDAGETIRIPVAHHDGNYHADDSTLDRLEQNGRLAPADARGEGVDPGLVLGDAGRAAGGELRAVAERDVVRDEDRQRTRLRSPVDLGLDRPGQ